MRKTWAAIAMTMLVAGSVAAMPIESASAQQHGGQKWDNRGGGNKGGAKNAAVRGGKNQGARNQAVRGGARNARVAQGGAYRGGKAYRGGPRWNNNVHVYHARYRGNYYGGRRWYRGGYWGGRYWGPGYYDYGWGGWGAAAAVGVVAGAAVGAAIASPTYYEANGRYIPSGATVTTNVPPAGGYAPFSPGYIEYCSSKYRSFNANTGMYTGYDGYRHYCQ